MPEGLAVATRQTRSCSMSVASAFLSRMGLLRLLRLAAGTAAGRRHLAVRALARGARGLLARRGPAAAASGHASSLLGFLRARGRCGRLRGGSRRTLLLLRETHGAHAEHDRSQERSTSLR